VGPLFDYWKEKEAAVAAIDKRVTDQVLGNPDVPLKKLAPLFGLSLPQLQYVVKKSGVTLKNGRKRDAE